MIIAPGTRLGPYEIVAELGEGGMGTVYRAHDARLGRDVAVKVLRADVAADRDRRLRFIQEAKAVSSLSHPNIVAVYDIGTEGDIVYMVQELVNGRPLDQLIPAGGFRVSEVLRMGAQMADACAKAHAQQIVHRDLKPANVMVQEDGRVKVLDFGLAKIIESGSREGSMTQTAAGTILGTVAYMSPEQAEGKNTDARSDIFSLGAVLYEISTGTRPFRGDSQASVLAGVLKDEPQPLDQLRADLPPELSRLIMRCLRKDPARRVQSMADLRVALEDLKDDVHSVAATTSSRKHGGRRTTIFAAAGIVGLAAIAITWFATKGERSAGSATAEALTAVPLTSYPGTERAGSFSPDGSQLVFAWDGERSDNVDVYVKLIGPGPPLRLTTDPAEDHEARWSPDGKQIAFIRFLPGDRIDVLSVPPLGGAERRFGSFFARRNIMPLTAIAWTADSKHLLVAAGLTKGEPNSIHRIDLDTGAIAPAWPVKTAADGYARLDVSPDGRRLAAVFGNEGSRALELFDVSADGTLSNQQRVEHVAANFDEVRWTPDSQDLIFSPSVNNPLPLYRFSLRKRTTSTLPWLGPGANSPAVSAAASRMVFTRDVRDTNIWRVALGTTGGGRPVMDKVAVSSFREVAPQYSPDGRRMAFHSNRGGSVQIWTAEADGSHAVQLTSLDDMATTGTPRWSPDSRQLVFDSNSGGGYHVYVVSADGGQPRAVTSGPSRNFVGAWTPDGKWIYFTSDRTGRLDIWRTPPAGGTAEQVTHGGAQAPIISADGQWLYFDKEDGANGLWRMPIGGGPETRLVETAFRYNFYPTATGLYYVATPNADRTSSVRYLDFATKKTVEIAPIDSRVDLGLAISPDGKYLLFTKIDYLGADLMVVERFR